MGYVAPAMLLLIFLLVIPLFYTLYCSLYNLDYLVKGDFVGLGNYVRIRFKSQTEFRILLITNTYVYILHQRFHDGLRLLLRP